MRSGDTPQRERAAMRRRPPDILITTPESLYLILTSAAREMLAGVQTVIVDEIHALAAGKRGTHLALSLERLAHLTGGDPQRIGLSATQRPLDEIARFLGGDRPVEIVDAGHRKPLDLEVVVPVPDMRELGGAPGARRRAAPVDLARDLSAPARAGALPPLDARLREQPPRRRARRPPPERPGRGGDRPRAPRLDRPRAAARDRGDAEDRPPAGARRHVVARARHRHGRDRPGRAGRVAQVGRRRPPARRPCRPPRRRRQLGPVLPEVPRRPARDSGRRRPHARGGDRAHARPPPAARRARPAARRDDGDGRVGGRRPARHGDPRGARTATSAARSSTACSTCSPAAIRPTSSPSFGRGSCGTARPASCAAATTPAGSRSPRAARSPTAASTASSWPTRGRGWGSSTRRWSTRPAPARSSSWARRRGGSSRSRATACSSRRRRACRGACRSGRATASGRPYELGRAVGEAARTRRFGDLDELAASNLTTYLDDQEAATGVIPSDRTIVVERFRDEIGDWRVCVLSPFGGRVHAPWALAVERSDGRGARDRGRVAVGRRRHRDPPAGLRHAAADRPDRDPARRPRRPPDRPGLREPALRGAVPRERGPRAPHPAPPPRAANAALAAAAEGARPPAGRAEVRLVPGPARDLPRGAVGRLRGAGAEGPPAGDRRRGGAPGRGRVGGAVAVRLVAPLRLHRDLHVRGRRAGGRAARPGAPARPGAARRAPAHR